MNESHAYCNDVEYEKNWGTRNQQYTMYQSYSLLNSEDKNSGSASEDEELDVSSERQILLYIDYKKNLKKRKYVNMYFSKLFQKDLFCKSKT